MHLRLIICIRVKSFDPSLLLDLLSLLSARDILSARSNGDQIASDMIRAIRTKFQEHREDGEGTRDRVKSRLFLSALCLWARTCTCTKI